MHKIMSPSVQRHDDTFDSREAAQARATCSGRVPQSAVEAELQAFDGKRPAAALHRKDVRKHEAKCMLMDIEIKAGQPGSDLCRSTAYNSASKQRGK